MSTAVPVIALTGYLGAGKTTLLNHVLRRPDARIGLVINDFGEINVDAGLVTGHLAPPDMAECATVDQVFRPDPDASALYEERHTEFVGLHKELKGVAHRLHRLQRTST